MATYQERRVASMSIELIKNKNGFSYKAIVRIRGWKKCKTFRRKEDAKRWERNQLELKDKIAINNNFVDTDLTLEQLIEEWKAFLYPRIEKSSQDFYNKVCSSVKPIFNVKVVQLNARMIDDWIIQIKENYKADVKPKKAKRYSFKKEVEMLNQVLRWYREYKNENYVVPIMKRHKDLAFLAKKSLRYIREYMLSDEVPKFLNALLKISILHWRLAIFQLETGCRIGEAAGVTWQAINFDKKEIFLEKIVVWDYRKNHYIKDGTKTGEVRKVFMTQDLISMLREMKKERNDCEFIFNENGENLKYKHIQFAYNKAFSKAGIRLSGTHVLRKTFATLLAECTNDMRAVQSILGHKDARMTSHYSKVTELSQKKSIKLFDELRPFSIDKKINNKDLLN